MIQRIAAVLKCRPHLRQGFGDKEFERPNLGAHRHNLDKLVRSGVVHELQWSWHSHRNSAGVDNYENAMKFKNFLKALCSYCSSISTNTNSNSMRYLEQAIEALW